jgi:hypothetical protein
MRHPPLLGRRASWPDAGRGGHAAHRPTMLIAHQSAVIDSRSTNSPAHCQTRQRAALSRRVANMTAATAAPVGRPAVSGEPRCSPRVAYFFLAAFFLAAFLGAAFFLAAFFLATFRPPSKGSWRGRFGVLPFHEVHAGPAPFHKTTSLFGEDGPREDRSSIAFAWSVDTNLWHPR